jgi:hypothetical protein
MKKLMIMYFLIVQPITIIGMNVEKEIEKVKRLEHVRQTFKRRDSIDMSSESSTQTDDEMSLDRSGSFSTLSKSFIIQKKSSGCLINHHGYSPSQKAPSSVITKWEMYKLWDDMPEVQKELMKEVREKIKRKK